MTKPAPTPCGFAQIMRILILISLVAVIMSLSGCQSTPSSSKVSGRVIRYGLYRTPDESIRVPIPAAPTGQGRYLPQEPVFVMEASRIPATLGVRFGFDFEVTGLPPTLVQLRSVAIYPPIRRPDGSVATGHELAYPLLLPVDGRVATSIGFGFDKDYELVPGKWTLQILDEDKKIVERAFEVYRP